MPLYGWGNGGSQENMTQEGAENFPWRGRSRHVPQEKQPQGSAAGDPQGKHHSPCRVLGKVPRG